MHPHFCFVIPQCRLTTRPQSNFTKSKPRCALARSRSTSTNFFHELIPPLQQFFFPFFGLFGLLNFQFPQNFPFLNVTGLTSWPSVGIFDPLQNSSRKASWFSLWYIFVSRHPIQPILLLIPQSRMITRPWRTLRVPKEPSLARSRSTTHHLKHRNYWMLKRTLQMHCFFLLFFGFISVNDFLEFPPTDCQPLTSNDHPTPSGLSLAPSDIENLQIYFHIFLYEKEPT